MAATLIISDSDYQEISTCLGWPIVKVEDWGLTEDQLKDIFILKTLKDVYFKWFPIVNEQEYSITSNFEIDFPDLNTFGVIDARLIWKRAQFDAGSRENPFVYGQSINIKTSVAGRSANMWDSGNDYGYTQVYEMEKMYNQSVISTEKAVKKRVDYTNRQLVGFTNTAGNLVVQWAKYSEDFNDVPQKFLSEVRDLAKSRILMYFGRLLNKGTGNLPTELTGDDLIDEAEALQDEIMAKWKGYSKVVLMRG